MTTTSRALSMAAAVLVAAALAAGPASAAPAPVPVLIGPADRASVRPYSHPTFTWRVDDPAVGAYDTWVTFRWGGDRPNRQALYGTHLTSFANAQGRFRLKEWLLAGSYTWTVHNRGGTRQDDQPLEESTATRRFTVPTVLTLGTVQLRRLNGAGVPNIFTHGWSNAALTTITYRVTENGRVLYRNRIVYDWRTYARDQRTDIATDKGSGYLQNCTCRSGARIVYTVTMSANGKRVSKTARMTMR